MAAVAQDLSQDFYEYFVKVFCTLTKLLETRDGDQVEWTLTCIVTTFIAVKGKLLKHFSEIFALILPELSDEKPPEIVTFLAECFAFVVRDLARDKAFFTFILKAINDQHVFGIGRLIFEIIRGLAGKLHLAGENVLKNTLGLFLEPKPDKRLFHIHVQLFTDVAENLNETEPVIRILKETLGKCDGNEWATQHILKLIGQLVESSRSPLKSEVLLESVNLIFTQIDEMKVKDDETCLILTRLVAALLLSKRVTIQQPHMGNLCTKCLCIPKVAIVAEFVATMKNFSEFDTLILPKLVLFAASAEVQSVEVLHIFCTLFMDKGYLWTSGSCVPEGKDKF